MLTIKLETVQLDPLVKLVIALTFELLPYVLQQFLQELCEFDLITDKVLIVLNVGRSRYLKQSNQQTEILQAENSIRH